MRENNEYIVFLKNLKVHENYKMSDKNKVSFIFVLSTLGKFNKDETNSMILNESDIKNDKTIYNMVKN
jgi:hypothetical protein